MADGDGGQQMPVNLQVDQEALKDTFQELLNEIPGLRTLTPAGSAGDECRFVQSSPIK